MKKADFIILDRLGRGASAAVFKASYTPTGEIFALKSINVFDQAKRK